MIKYATVRIPYASVRSDPRDSAVPVGILEKGLSVRILDEDCGWSLIEWRQKHSDPIVGWTKNQGLQITPEECNEKGILKWASLAIFVFVLALFLMRYR